MNAQTDDNTTDDHCPECNEYESECACYPTRYYLFVNSAWEHAAEYVDERLARYRLEAILSSGDADVRKAAVYAAPDRQTFEAKMRGDCQLVIAAVPGWTRAERV